MRLSKLQKYILRTALDFPRQIDRKVFLGYYKRGKQEQIKAPSPVIQTKNVTKSLERLIDKELMIGFGYRTKHRWFIDKVALTAIGKKTGQELISQQQSLPLRKKRGYNNSGHASNAKKN